MVRQACGSAPTGHDTRRPRHRGRYRELTIAAAPFGGVGGVSGGRLGAVGGGWGAVGGGGQRRRARGGRAVRTS